MSKYYFFDDWILDGTRDMKQVFITAKDSVKCISEHSINPNGIIKENDNTFKCWSTDYQWDTKKNKMISVPMYLVSEDGINWSKEKSINSEWNLGFCVFKDNKYMSTTSDGYILTSPDGFKWTKDLKMHYSKNLIEEGTYSDSLNDLTYNPITSEYQITYRAQMADRRISIAKSSDLYNWENVYNVISPDAYDVPLTQMYGMKQFFDGEIFIGLLNKFFVPNEERRYEHKMWGAIQTELIYSYNGINWLRPNRDKFLQNSEPPNLGYNNLYGSNIIDNGDHYLIYALGCALHNTGIDKYVEENKPYREALVYKVRKDGFCCMESTGGWGEMWTRTLQPTNSNLTVNYQSLSENDSTLLMQITDNSWKPIEGFTFDNFIPLQGDSIKATPQWKDHNISELSGKNCKIEFKMFNTRVYSFTWDAKILYGPRFTKERIHNMHKMKSVERMQLD